MNQNKMWENQEKYLLDLPRVRYPFSPKEYGKLLETLRNKHGYSYHDVAECLGCTPQHVEQIEKGKYKAISPKWVPHFAKLYSCSCAYLLGVVPTPGGILYRDTPYSFPVIRFQSDELVTIADVTHAYKRDPALFILYLELSKSSPEKRKSGRDKLRELLKSKN